MDTVPRSDCCLSVDLRQALLHNLPQQEEEVRQRELWVGWSGGLVKEGDGEEEGSMTCESVCC